MERSKEIWQSFSLFLLILCAGLLICRVAYLFVTDNQRFPIKVIKISATYQHISREQLETILNASLSGNNFFTLPVKQLQKNLGALPWTRSVMVTRIWPDVLSIHLRENNPVARWNAGVLMQDGRVFDDLDWQEMGALPTLHGPQNQQQEVLQLYQKMSKIVSNYGLKVTSLEKRENLAWQLGLANGLVLFLGKDNIESRLERFCKAYPAVFEGKVNSNTVVSVDLRYPRGMAVKWNQTVSPSLGNEKTGK